MVLRRRPQHLHVFVIVIIGVLLLAALRSEQSLNVASAPFSAPSPAHLLGTDQFGRDVLSRVLSGGMRSLLGAGLATLIALVIGLIFGGISGGLGGWADWVLMRFTDMLLAIPGVLLAMAFAAAFGAGTISASLGVGIGLAPAFARLIRSTVQSQKSQPYIEAAKALGAGPLRVTAIHLIPNVLPQVAPFAGVLFAWSLLSIGGLEFLGLVGSPSDPSWGRMIAEGRSYLREAPWIALSPAVAIMMTTLFIMGLSNSYDGTRKRKMSPEDGDIFP